MEKEIMVLCFAHHEKNTPKSTFLVSVENTTYLISFLITFQKIKGEVFPEGIPLY